VGTGTQKNAKDRPLQEKSGPPRKAALQKQGGGTLGDEGDFALFLAGGFHGDLHVLAKGGEKVHETLDGKGAGAVAHQGRNVRLLDAEDLAGFGCLRPRFLMRR